MRLYGGKVKPLSDEIVKALVQNKDIETESATEVVRDIEAVFNGYLVAEKDATDKAKAAIESRNMPQTEFGRLKRNFAEQAGIKVGDDMFDYLLDQCIEMLMHSGNVEEVFAEDHELRRRMRPVLRKYLEIDEAVDAEVRGKLKHVTEGSQTWEIEYRRVMEQIKQRKGLG